MTSLPAPKGPALQFVSSKNDLITRNSDRIRFCSKAQRLITERLGRSFEILPASLGDVNAFLDCDASEQVFTVGGVEFTLPRQSNMHATDGETKQDLVLARVADLAKEASIRTSRQTLRSMRTDCEALIRETEIQFAEAYRKGQAATSSSRGTLIQVGVAFLIVGSIVPFILEDDVEQWLMVLWICLAFGLALALLVIAFSLPPPPKLESNFEQRVAALEEQGRYLRLLAKQWALWCGEPLLAESSAESGKIDPGRTEGASQRSKVEASSKPKDDAFSI